MLKKKKRLSMRKELRKEFSLPVVGDWWRLRFLDDILEEREKPPVAE